MSTGVKDMAEPITTGLASAATTKIVSNVVDDLYLYLKNKATYHIKKADINRKLPNLINNINNVRFVKTLWQVDKAVDVESFYCDSHIILENKRGRKNSRKKINLVSDLKTNNNLVIRGIAGQGKSILLRHLFINEIGVGHHIPIFIEFRRIQKNETLLTHISRFLYILDLPIDDKIFQVLSKSGKFMFFLDGFDEIPDEQLSSILNELEYLVSISRDCQFIVTSRPNSPIEMSPLFNVVILDDLQGNEYEKVIKKLSDTPKYADTIIKRIKSQKSAVSELLCTPLLVTLLLISYKSYQEIPVQLSDFYESIFITLLQRHDGTKPTFTRPRNCSLNDNQYRQIFDAFCFESKKQKGNYFNYQQIYSLLEKSMSLLGINEDVDSYIKDIKNVTCLLLEESNQYRFIHRSVQEYYSASFIRTRPENITVKFYSTCQKDEVAVRWSQELDFLSDIDKYRHHKYYLIPICSRMMGYDHDVEYSFIHPEAMSLERTKNILGSYLMGFTENGKPLMNRLYWGYRNNYWDYLGSGLTMELFHLDYTEVISSISSGKFVINIEESIRQFLISISKHDKEKLTWISINQMLDEGFLINEIQQIAQNISSQAYILWNKAISYINTEDSFINTFDMV